MSNYVEIDLSGLGYRELDTAINLLKAYMVYGAPSGFDTDSLKIGFNLNSGYVFLTNEDYQVCMLSDGKLEMWLTCGNCGNEGFIEDFEHCDGFNEDEGECGECSPIAEQEDLEEEMRP